MPWHVTVESAGVTLVRGDPLGVAQTIEMSRATMRNMHQYLLLAFAYNALGIGHSRARRSEGFSEC